MAGMSEVTKILDQIQHGDRQTAGDLLPLVYAELRRLAAAQLAREKPGQTLNATALVHDAYLRLVGPEDEERWQSRGHFFAAAAEAMRHILVDIARRKGRKKREGKRVRMSLDAVEPAAAAPYDDLLALDEALTRLAGADHTAAELVKLRYFAGLTIPQAAEALGIGARSADRLWAYARAWLRDALSGTSMPLCDSGRGLLGQLLTGEVRILDAENAREIGSLGSHARGGQRGLQPGRTAPGHRRLARDGPFLGPWYGTGDLEAEQGIECVQRAFSAHLPPTNGSAGKVRSRIRSWKSGRERSGSRAGSGDSSSRS
jgi:RNA polymerase sigma factor (TIGR02999 family)